MKVPIVGTDSSVDTVKLLAGLGLSCALLEMVL
jgi:hypothetical protein